jgi:hypothetical protein
MTKFIRGALNAFEIVSKRSHYCLFHRAGFLCHTVFLGLFAHNYPVLPF